MAKRIGAVVAGLLAGFLVVGLIEGVSSWIYPPPQGLDFSDREALRAFVAGLPLGAFALVLVAHLAGPFAGAFTCGVIVRDPWLTGSLIIGGVFLLGGLVNLFLLPHPVWFAILDVLLYLPAAVAGGAVAHRWFSGTAVVDAEDKST